MATATREYGLCLKQTRFVREFPIDLNGTQAVVRSGYSENGASVTACRLLANPKIQAALAVEFDKIAKRVNLTQEFVLNGLIENYRRSVQITPVYGKDGQETGEFRYEGNVANRALELLGKHLGMFRDGPAVEINNYVVEVPVKEQSAEAWRQRFAVTPN